MRNNQLNKSIPDCSVGIGLVFTRGSGNGIVRPGKGKDGKESKKVGKDYEKEERNIQLEIKDPCQKGVLLGQRKSGKQMTGIVKEFAPIDTDGCIEGNCGGQRNCGLY